MNCLNMKVERVTCWQAFCFISPEPIEKERNAHTMQIIIAFWKVCGVYMVVNVVFERLNHKLWQ